MTEFSDEFSLRPGIACTICSVNQNRSDQSTTTQLKEICMMLDVPRAMNSITACSDTRMSSWNGVMDERTLNAKEVAFAPL